MVDPTYRDLGNHSEAIAIDFDPELITYEDLLDIYWDSHRPTRKAWSNQYASSIFFHSPEQERAANESRDRQAEIWDSKIHTKIRPASRFYRAEDYHQKYRLRNHRGLAGEFARIFASDREFVDATATARVNGFLSGYGRADQIEAELKRLGVTDEARQRFLKLLAG